MPVYSINLSNDDNKIFNHCIWLIAACGDLKKLAEFKSKGYDLNQCDNLNQTPLHWAAQEGQLNAVCLLLSYGVNINNQNINGDTPLHLAVKGAHLEVIKVLIAAGANANIKNSEGNSPLFYAEHLDHEPEIVFLLLESAEQSTLPTNSLGQCLLHKAAEFGITDLICQLLDRQYDINIVDNQGKTPLHIACENGQETAVKWLINFGANPNILTVDKQTVLHSLAGWAVCLDTMKNIARLLMKAGVQLRSRDKDGLTALEISESNLEEKEYALFKQFFNKELAKMRQDRMILIASSVN